MKSDDDSDPPPSDWDQDESSVMMKILLPEHDHNKDIKVDVTEKSCSICHKDVTIWSVELFEEVIPATKKIQFMQNEVSIHVEKKLKNVEWTSLEAPRTVSREGLSRSGRTPLSWKETDKEEANKQEVVEEEAEEDRKTLKECNIDHIKNDMFEKDVQTLTLCLYVKQVIKETIYVEFQKEKLIVCFQTKDENFHRLHENTDATTRFHWSSQLKEPIVADKCKFSIKTASIEVVLRKQKHCKWGMLSKPHAQRGDSSSVGSGDWVPLKQIQSNNTTSSGSRDTGKSNSDKNSRQKENHGARGGAKSVNITDNRAQKPTCAVPPLAHRQQGTSKDGSVQPVQPLGFTGLDNLGNTCFMNGVLQVLANTRELKDFMLEDNVTNEINYDNPLGTGGQLVTSFAVLMKLLWSEKYKSYAPSKFKTIIASKASQFMGFAQHDAQEFMDFLLDGLHEDLNRVKVKPYTVTVDSDGRPDEVIAEESWKRHKRRNDSFIADIFQGQYKSKLVCPVCNKVSITFDPFMQLSVPLPRKKQHVQVFFWSKEVYKKPVRMKLLVTTEGDIFELKEAISDRTGVDPLNLRVFEVFKGRVHKYFKDNDPLSAIALNDIIFVCEILSEKLAGEEVYECMIFQRKSYPSPLQYCSYCRTESQGTNTLKRCTRCLKAAYCNQDCQKKHWDTHKPSCRPSLEPIGMPFMMSLPASHATYARICETMESIARYSTNMFQPPVCTSSGSHSPSSPTSGKAASSDEEDGATEAESRMEEDMSDDEDVDAELAAEMIVKDSPHQSSDEDDREKGAVGGESRRKKEETSGEKKSGDGVATASVIGQPQVSERRPPLFCITPCNSQGTSLRGTIGERLADQGDKPLDLSQYCALSMDWRNDPKQANHVLVESKPLDYDEDVAGNRSTSEKVTTLEQCLQLFTETEKLAPEEAWYCPQCKEHREASKQLSLWRLPSVLIIQLKRFSFKNFIWRDKIDKMVEFPLRGLDLSEFSQVKGQLPVYDLFGVINHHGGILGGHYTAFAKLISKENINQNELDWRLFDDSHVTRTTEDNVVTRSAYLLFFRQRKPYVTYVPRSVLLDSQKRSKEAPTTRSKSGTKDPQKTPASSAGTRTVKTPPERDENRQEKLQEEEEEGEEEEGESAGVKEASKEEKVPYTNIDEID